MAKYIICDIDGCLVDTSWLWGIINQLKTRFDDVNPFEIFDKNANLSFCRVDSMLVIYLKQLLERLYDGKKPTLLLMTARSESIKDETTEFILAKSDLKYFHVSFRETGDMSNPSESKRKRLERLLECGHEIVLAIDDDSENLKMFENYGIETLQWKFGFIPQMLIEKPSTIFGGV